MRSYETRTPITETRLIKILKSYKSYARPTSLTALSI